MAFVMDPGTSLRRTPMRRQSATPRCKHCRVRFTPARIGQELCGDPDCAIAYALKCREKRLADEKRKAAAAAKRERAEDRAKKEKSKGLRDLVREAQEAFNEFIRLRDHDKPCVSCGTTNPPDRHGGQWDCGHFLSRGARPELRFIEDNAAKQCKPCNAGGGRFRHLEATIGQKFEAELRRRIGNERVDWLKGPHEPLKLMHDSLRDVRDHYRAKVRELKKARAS